MSGHALVRGLSIFLVILTGICYCNQLIYLFLPLILKKKPHSVPKSTRYAILIAARNEETVLPYLLDSIRGQNYPASLVTTYVIADNCTDGTAAAARNHGARVYQRFDPAHVGKGYALNYLLEQIRLSGELDSYDAFLVFDADNLLQPGYITAINRVCSDGFPAFCGYRNTKNYGSNWISAAYGLWYLHDSAHLNRSRMLLGTACTINGTGFGFTRQLLEQMGGWNYFTLTEDSEFSAWCATHGIRVGYSHDAVLYDEQPTSFRQSWRQRTRWVQGGVQVSIRCTGDMVRGILRGGRTGYASFETAAASLWGCCLSILSAVTALVSAFLEAGWVGVAGAFLSSLAGAYWTLFAMGVLTMLSEHRRIRATAGQKLRSLLTLPLFMMTYVPVALSAVFRKFQWQPIAHTVAIPVEELNGKT